MHHDVRWWIRMRGEYRENWNEGGYYKIGKVELSFLFLISKKYISAMSLLITDLMVSR